MDKLEVSPQSVRGYGNIIIPKLSTDFVSKYNEIYTDEDGYFVLSYGGVMLKASATVSNTIKGIQASLTVIVSTRDSDTPVSGLSVACSVDDTALTSQTTDSTGKCTFTWTPSDLGDSSLLISISPQDNYAGLSLDKTVTVGLLLGFDGIMTSLSLEDDEVYTGTFEEQVEGRSQLSEFVKDVWVASGGEPIVDEYGIIHICEPGDLVVESEGLEQLPEYSNVLFEEDVDLLTGAVYDMAINEDYEIVLDCLERSDIVPDVPPVPVEFDGVSLSADESTIGYGESVTLTAQLTDDGSPVSISGETVSFYDGETLIGSEDTDSTGVATFTSSNFDVGSHSVTGVCDEYTSNSVSVTVNKLPLEYQEVEYIENTGTSYIDTGFKPNNNTRTYIRFYAGTLGTNVRAIFGSRDATNYNDSYTSFYLGSNTTSTGRMRVDYYNTNSNNVYLFPNTSDKTEYELDYNKNIVTLNGATHTFTPQTFNSNNNIFLFTCNSGGIADNRMMIGKIYACKIWDNEVLIRDLIPCYRISDNVIGLYDIVNDVFYTNSGTGTFSKGPDVPQLFDGISLSSDESILSYADGDTCTLTAQLTDDDSPVSVEGVTVEFFNGSTSLGTATTNSSGVATKSYASAGSGDISVSAEVDEISSNSVSIEDCIRYDGATSDKTSNYSKTNLNSLTFSTDHYEAYRSLGTSPSSTFYSPIYIDETLPTDFEMSVMYKASNMNREQTEFIISSTHPTTYSGATELGIVVTDSRRGLFHRVSGSATWYTESSTLSNNTWYTFYLKVEGTTVTGKILDSSDNTVYTSTQTINNAQNYKKWSIINGGNSRTLHWKELKIKTL